MYKRWTKEDMEWLEDKWGIWSVKRLSKHFGRSETAIVEKAEKMKLGGAYAQYLTTNQIGQMFGIHRQTVLRTWIGKCGLKASSSKLRKQKIYRVTLEDLIDWCYNNQDKWSAENLALHAFGEEFQWLEEKRKVESAECTVKSGFWTMSEYSLLIKLSNEGVPLKDIASRLNRTYYSVRRKRQQYLDSQRADGAGCTAECILRQKRAV